MPFLFVIFTKSAVVAVLRGDETNNAELSAGAAYVLVRVAGVWSQLAYVKASNPDAGDLFGGVLSLCADGASLIVGAVQEYSNSTGIGSTPNELAPDSGAAYLF